MFITKFLWLCALTLLSVHNVIGLHVQITNKLKGDLMLIVHCKSKNDDFGVHVIFPSENYRFSFGHNFFAKTLFYCSFK